MIFLDNQQKIKISVLQARKGIERMIFLDNKICRKIEDLSRTKYTYLDKKSFALMICIREIDKSGFIERKYRKIQKLTLNENTKKIQKLTVVTARKILNIPYSTKETDIKIWAKHL